MIHPADAHLLAQRSANDKEKHLKIQTQIDYSATPTLTLPSLSTMWSQVTPCIFWPKQFRLKSLPAEMF